MTTRGNDLGRLVYEQNEAINRNRELSGQSGAVIMRRIVENATLTITTLTITTRGPAYFCDNDPTGIADAGVDEAIVGFAKLS